MLENVIGSITARKECSINFSLMNMEKSFFFNLAVKSEIHSIKQCISKENSLNSPSMELKHYNDNLNLIDDLILKIDF